MAPNAAGVGRVLALLALAWFAAPLPVSAETPYYGPAKQEQDVFNGNQNGGSRSGGSVLDATNPIDLMNRIRRSTAMDDATAPDDAVDQALKALEAQAPPASPSAPLVKAP